MSDSDDDNDITINIDIKKETNKKEEKVKEEKKEDPTVEVIDNDTDDNIPLTKRNSEPTAIELTTIPLSPEPQQKDIVITSDNFINGKPQINPKEIYLVHQNLQTVSALPEVTYRNISIEFLPQLMAVHKELSPIEYDVTYFKKHIIKKTYFALGAFITINNEEYLVGFILSEITSEKKFRNNVPNVLTKKTCLETISNIFKSASDKYAYISNLGVINEYRNRKIGIELVNKMVQMLKEKDVVAIYLHVIEHNCSGIKFFEKIGWNYGGVIFGFYNFEHNYFNGQVFYNVLNKQNNFEEVELRGYNEPPIDRTCWFVKCCKYIKKTITT